ncbi:hypothetical protein SAMN05444487_10285 [Marininema mesophilum]|uniref:Stage II sporulation protein B n=1 Tax=Marininema mesophilum TaxID=1048340 RepID=A0A1H2S475_9BACL|nr:hypothetical protein [Marininema mesophilum]SDW25974.1 hypothetical protein SAMN05444487_10285 [Marininema mesophilum]
MEKSRITVRLNGTVTGPKSEQMSTKLPNSLTNSSVIAADKGEQRVNPWTVREVDEDGVEWGTPYSRKRTPSGKRGKGALALSIGAAVIIGTLMGIVVLSLFFPDDKNPTTGTIDSHVKTVPSQQEGATTSKLKPSKVPIKKTEAKISLPQLKAVLIQRGIFQKKSGASKTVMSQRTQGRAAVMTDKAPYRIYQAVAQDKENANKVFASLKEKSGQITYKNTTIGQSVPLPKESSTKWNKVLILAVKEGNHIFSTMVATTVKGVSSPTDLKNFKDSRIKVNASYTRFTKVRDDVEAELPSSVKSEWSEMVRAMDLVVQSCQTDQPNKAMYWQIQEGLVRYVLAYEKFLEALS